MIINPQSAPSDPSSSTHATHRLKRGSRLADSPASTITEVPPLSQLNGPFQLAEYLALQVKHDPHDVAALVNVPESDGQAGGKAPETNVWIYEHLRRLPIDLTALLTGLLPVCSKESCPEMKADQWLYFCSAHPATEECCAIDYILHTVDSTIALLNSSQQFPSRMSIPKASLSHFPSLFRRLSRVFSHAYFHHREVFSLAESETSLYARFVGLCERFELVGADLLVVPPDVVGSFSKEARERLSESDEEDDEADEEDEDEDEGDEEEENDTRGRGEKGDTREKRTRSLDRHGPPSSPGLTKPPLGRTGTAVPDGETTLPAMTSESHNISPNQADPFRSSPRSAGSLRAGLNGTLGRGKQSRGTMLWNSDMSDTIGGKGVPIGPELTRSESAQTAILLEEPEEVAAPSQSSEVVGAKEEEQVEELPVPKDEIELLEEEGVIPPENRVSPLPPAESASLAPEANDTAASQSGEADGSTDEKETGKLPKVSDADKADKVVEGDLEPPSKAVKIGSGAEGEQTKATGKEGETEEKSAGDAEPKAEVSEEAGDAEEAKSDES